MTMRLIKNILSALCLALAFALPLRAQENAALLPVRKVAAERLPDLGVPRSGHAALCLPSGELIVFGGHTTGFVPTPTAEWFDGKAWHTLHMTYAHDQGIVLPLSDGRILLAGGHEQPLGIGQTFTLETYDPNTRTFGSFGCMDRKRCFASAAELGDGSVLIAGNWYEADGMELWNDSSQNLKLKDVSMARCLPYVLRTAADDAILFGNRNEHGDSLAQCATVDRLKDKAYEEPFLREWHPLREQIDWRSYVSFVGDEASGRYAYIMPVENGEGRLALALVDGGRFSPLKTDYDIPREYDGRRISWISRFIADRHTGRGYIVGVDAEKHFFVLCADYAGVLDGSKVAVSLSLLLVEAHDDMGDSPCPVLTPEGDIILAGGVLTDNFTPTAAVWRLPLGGEASTESCTLSPSSPWLWGALGAAVLLCLLYIIYNKVRRRKIDAIHVCADDEAVSYGEEQTEVASDEVGMMKRLEACVHEEQRFLQAGLRIAEVAVAVGVSERDISACLRRAGYRSFPDYLNALRVDYACNLLRRNPEIKIRALSASAGFASESAFYSAFRERTGAAPKQWLAENAR